LLDSARQRKIATEHSPADLSNDKVVRQRVGQKIQSLRLQAGYSQEELCTRAGLNRTYLSDIERGEGNATVTVLSKICSALEINLSDLFAGIEPTNKSPARILLADTANGYTRLSRLLEGHTIVHVDRYADALAILDRETFDLIVGGLHFTEERMFDLLRAIKLHDGHRDTPFICFRDGSSDPLSGLLGQSVQIACSALGASIFLDSSKYARGPEGDARIRRELEHWLPVGKWLLTG
jgi:transcriptional regulator with XRE-family HTH domain